jgi:hypothetical protein
MRYAAPFGLGWFGSADVHQAVDLAGVGVDYFGAEVLGEVEC